MKKVWTINGMEKDTTHNISGDTLEQAMLDHIRQYYPETTDDWTYKGRDVSRIKEHMAPRPAEDYYGNKLA